MVLDKMEFSDAQAITASGTTISESVLDLDLVAPDVGPGTPIWLVCRINTTFAGDSNSMRVEFANSTASATGFFINSLRSATWTVAALIKGLDVMSGVLPLDLLQHLRLQYIQTGGSGFTAGNIDAFLTLAAPQNEI